MTKISQYSAIAIHVRKLDYYLMPTQKGFSLWLLIVIVTLLTIGIIGGVYYINEHTQLLSNASYKPPSQNIPSVTTTPVKSSSSPASTSTNTQAPLPKPEILVTNSNEWKELTLTTCMITIKYPFSWEIEKYEEGRSCALQIKEPNTKASFSLLTTSTGRDKLDLSTIPGNSTAEQVKTSDATFYIYNDKNPKRYSFSKGNVLFSGLLRNPSNNLETEQIFKSILSSIKLIGTENNYTQPSNSGFEDDPAVLKLL